MNKTLPTLPLSALWSPTRTRIEKTKLFEFSNIISQKYSIDASRYLDLHAWSLSNTSAFWNEVASFTELQWTKTDFAPLNPRKIFNQKWYPGSHLSFAKNIIEPSLNGLQLSDDRLAVICRDESGRRETYTFAELRAAVFACQTWLRSQNVRQGDIVAGILTNCFEAVVCMLATQAVGAIWSSCSPDFGTQGIKDRFLQLSPRVVFYSKRYGYNGKIFDCTDQVMESFKEAKLLPTFVAIDKTNSNGDEFWSILKNHNLQNGPHAIDYYQSEFSDPLYILFSSGTTGLPKCITHGVGGTLLQHKKELVLHCDIQAGDRLFYFTTCGWMMWNWMVSALSIGATIVTYDGSPTMGFDNGLPASKSESLFNIVKDEQVTHFGTSPKYLSACQQQHPLGLSLIDDCIPTLRCILSTGSPLLPEQFDWVYGHLGKRDEKRNLHLASISGGTDIVSCFMLGVPTEPVYRGQIQAPGLGMAVEAWNDSQKTIREEKGELVCTQTFPSVPVKFWNDPDGSLMKKSYFDQYSTSDRDVWRHGDFISIGDNFGVTVFGRSDTTLNPGGIRIGTAEIYRVVEQLAWIVDSIVVGYPHQGDVVVVLFVKLRSDVDTTKYDSELKQLIKKQLTSRHVPKFIFTIKDIPYTRSGKKSEIAVLKTLLGESISNESALQNPDVLKNLNVARQLIETELDIKTSQ